ncbi:MAG: Lysine exporter protein [Verrucomicrobiales bacterium]|nr:Lysine exporter protein [Verrucomicrobiales bacterium]
MLALRSVFNFSEVANTLTLAAVPLADTVVGNLLTSWFVGFIAGFLVSIPVGPINVTIINEGARRGFMWAFLIGLGAVHMEAIYCALSFAGLTTFFDSKVVKTAMELFSFNLMLWLGLKYLRMHAVESTSPSADKVEEKLHPHSAFMTGFVRVLGNPGVLMMWLTLAATFTSHDWVDPNWGSKGLCIAGVGMGASLWFLMLSYLVSMRKKGFSTRTLLRMSKISGAVLLIAAAFIGVKIVKNLYEYHKLRNGG